MALSRPVEHNILNAIFQGSSFTVNSLYMALFRATPDNVSSGTEMSFGITQYARQGVSSWSTATTSSQIGNLETVNFGPFILAVNTLDGMGLFDAGSEGMRVTQAFFAGGAISVVSGDSVSVGLDNHITVVQSC